MGVLTTFSKVSLGVFPFETMTDLSGVKAVYRLANLLCLEELRCPLNLAHYFPVLEPLRPPVAL